MYTAENDLRMYEVRPRTCRSSATTAFVRCHSPTHGPIRLHRARCLRCRFRIVWNMLLHESGYPGDETSKERQGWCRDSIGHSCSRADDAFGRLSRSRSSGNGVGGSPRRDRGRGGASGGGDAVQRVVGPRGEDVGCGEAGLPAHAERTEGGHVSGVLR